MTSPNAICLNMLFSSLITRHCHMVFVLHYSWRNSLAVNFSGLHFRLMNFPKFWARGSSGDFFCWRWSSQSLAEAQSLADQAARQIAERFPDGVFPAKPGGYYPDRPFREEVLQEIKDGDGQITAVVTRNSYGCLVLNTARAMFVDIDFPESKSSGGFFSRFFGKPQPQPIVDLPAGTMTKIEDWTRNHADWGWRVYRTRAGLRLLATHAPVAANAANIDSVFSALGADALYWKLCNTQKCFRARLTPKPWRCGLRQKPERWPWLDDRRKKRFENWEGKYQVCSAQWATCEFLRQIGNPVVHPEIQSIIKIHDLPSRIESKLPLA